MGDRANVRLQHGPGAVSIYLYTHWRGTDLPAIVAEGLTNGRARWEDVPYLNRVIFSTLTRDQAGTDPLGFGLDTKAGDGEDRIVHVDTRERRVRLNIGPWYSFEEFIRRPPSWSWVSP